MSGCSNCSGCGGCGGCGGSLLLTPKEAELLNTFAQLPFQGVVRRPEKELPVLPETPQAECSLALVCLEKKGLVDVDCHAPLKGFDYSAYPGWLQGSAALTARGQEVLDSMEYQGVREE